MARAILRWSVNGEKANETGNAVRSALEDAGFQRVGTASWDGQGAISDLMKTLRDVLTTLENPLGGGTVDHVWMYLDTGPPSS